MQIPTVDIHIYYIIAGVYNMCNWVCQSLTSESESLSEEYCARMYIRTVTIYWMP